MLHGLPQDVTILSKHEIQSSPHHCEVNTRNANGIPMDLTDRPYPMCGQECPDCMYAGLPEKCLLERSHQKDHWCGTCGYSAASPGEHLSLAMEVNPKFLSSKQESSVSMDVDAESSLREIHITMPLIECKWCKRKKPCEQFEKYQRKNAYRKTCDNCCQFHCRFCGCSFNIKTRAADPPHYPACEANECKRRSAIKPRSCSNASCIYHKSKMNPWILNDNGETTFKPRSRGHFSAQCRRCQQMSDVKKGT